MTDTLKPDSLKPSEAIYAFTAWLTTRDEEITMSAHHDSAGPAMLVRDFCAVNRLTEPGEDWAKKEVRFPSPDSPKN